MNNILLKCFEENGINEYRIVSHCISCQCVKFIDEEIEESVEDKLKFIIIFFLYRNRLYKLKVNEISYNINRLINLLINNTISSENYINFKEVYDSSAISETLEFNTAKSILHEEYKTMNQIISLEYFDFIHTIDVVSSGGSFSEKKNTQYINILKRDGEFICSRLKRVENCIINAIENNSLRRYRKINKLENVLELKRAKFCKQPVMLIMHWLEYLLHYTNILAEKSLFKITKLDSQIVPKFISIISAIDGFFSIDAEGNRRASRYLIRDGMYVGIIGNRKTSYEVGLEAHDTRYDYFLRDTIVSPEQLSLEVNLPYSNNFSTVIEYIDPSTKKFDFVNGRVEFDMYGFNIIEGKRRAYKYKGDIISLLYKVQNIASETVEVESYVFNELILDFEYREGYDD